MGNFNTNSFLDIASRGGTATQATAGALGIPQCILDLGEDILSLLPTPILNALNKLAQDALEPLDRFVKYFVRKVRQLFGILVTIDEDGNTVYFFSFFKYALSPLALLNTINRYLQALTDLLGDIYNTIRDIEAEIERIKDCLNSLRRDGQRGFDELIRDNSTDQEYSDYISSRFSSDRRILVENDRLRGQLLDFQARIARILAQRRANPELEPELKPSTLLYLNGLGFRIAGPQKPKEIFRLSYGPPVAKKGKFILSIDGLYFDSQVSGVIPALSELSNRKSNLRKNLSWKFEHDPSLGGRGKNISIGTFKNYINTVLDPGILDDSFGLRQFYEQDELLQSLIGQKNRRIYDVSAQLQDAINGVSSIAIIENLKQVMLSESAHNQEKVDKRKKQIELAVKMPVLYNNESLFEPGQIPINDFSYLEGINFKVDINKQKKLTLDQQEVSGIILPLEVKYVQQIEQQEEVVLDHILINNIGLGGIVANGSGTMAPKLTINYNVESDKLVGLYNFLKFEVSVPSSTSFNLRNSSQIGDDLNGQLVGRSEPEIFRGGVGIPYLEGITKNSQVSSTVPSAVGSYVRLPQAPQLQDLFYNPVGATIETWVYTPDLDTSSGYNDGDVSGLYRLILANENTGISSGTSAQSNILELRRDNTTNFVKGMIFGFTRDRRLTNNMLPSNLNEDNHVSGSCLVLAPTQSHDSSSVGFINKSYYGNNGCLSISSVWHSMKFPVFTEVNGVSLSSCNNEFCLLSLTFDPQQNKIKMYCDGQLLTTSSYTNVFGIEKEGKIINVPSVKKLNSFEYNLLNMINTSSKDLKYGPKLDTNFTPWIIGGGYTDGMQTGNFMGGGYGGIISGLKGYIGSFKIYSKALSQDQILNNFNVSKDFFKNVDISKL